MSEARALTNIIGNGVATVVAAKWENELDEQKLYATLNPSALKMRFKPSLRIRYGKSGLRNEVLLTIHYLDVTRFPKNWVIFRIAAGISFCYTF